MYDYYPRHIAMDANTITKLDIIFKCYKKSITFLL